MKKSLLTKMLVVIAGAIFLNSGVMLAQNRPMHGKAPGINCPIPDLTEAQQKKIEELSIANQKVMMGFRNQLQEKQARLQTLRTADKADMNAINKTIDEIGVIKVQMMKERENHLQQIRSQLTEAQRLHFDMGKGKCHRQDFGPCGGNGCRGMRGARGFNPDSDK